MDASRRDYFRQAQTLQRQLGVLLAAGLLLSWLMSHAASRWLELLCLALLLLCTAGVFVVSARLFTRHYPAISLFNDRLWFRGLREQVVMLRHVAMHSSSSPTWPAGPVARSNCGSMTRLRATATAMPSSCSFRSMRWKPTRTRCWV